eukprot:gene18656-20537_t
MDDDLEDEDQYYSQVTDNNLSSDNSYIKKKPKISWPTYCLICLFGMGSWLAINGIWNEFPILVNHAPEKWSLPSYLTVICQLANLGPLIYSLGNKLWPRFVHERPAVYAMTIVGSSAYVLLAFFWNRTSYILGAERSTALLILSFFVALVDCTSTVVFLPFMAIFPEAYMSALFTGENLSSLLPSVFALIQGVDKQETVTSQTWFNHTYHNTTTVIFTGLNFSPRYFFIALTAMMLTCGAAFIAINHLPAVKRHHTMAYSALQLDKKLATAIVNSANPHDTTQQPLLVDSCPSPNIANMPDYLDEVSLTSVAGGFRAKPSKLDFCKSKMVFFYFLALQAWINCIANGVMSQVQSFATEPYGTSTYHLAVTLGGISSALICLVYMWMSTKSPRIISILASILSGIFVNYAKLAICTVMREWGHRDLFWCGVAIQGGSFIGAMVMFPLVNVAKVFKQ